MSRVNVVKIGAWCAGVCACIALASFALRGIVWAASTEFVTHDVLKARTDEIVSAVDTSVKTARQLDLDETILGLQLKVDNKEASKSDKAMLEYYLRQYRKSELAATKTN